MQKPGLGDTAAQYNSAYKLTSDTDIVKTYYGGGIVAVFVNNRAINVTIAAAKDHKAQKILNEMIPADAIKGEKETDESDEILVRENTAYTSERLKNAIPKCGGRFTRIDTYDRKTGNYIQTVLAIDNSQ